MLTAKAFHTDVRLCLGITGKAREGKCIYLFEGMVLKPLPRETQTDSRNQLVEDEMEPIIKNIEKKMSSLKETIANVGVSISVFPTFYEFQSSRQHDSMVTTPLFV